MLNDERDLFKKINELNNLLESITQKEVEIDIINGNLQITITNKNKQVMSNPNPDNEKLLDMDDELNDLHDFVSSLPTEI